MLRNSPAFYAAYGMVLCIFGEINDGYKFGKLALKLVDKLNVAEYTAETVTIFCNNIGFVKEPLRALLSPLIEANLVGLEYGNINYANAAAHVYCYSAYYAGEKLLAVEHKMSFYNDMMHKYKLKEWLYPNLVFHQALLNLMGNSDNPCLLKGEVYDEQEMLPLHLQAQERGTLWDIYLNKIMLFYMFDEPDKACQNAVLGKRYEDSAYGTYSISVFYFYESLALLSVFEKAFPQTHKKLMGKVVANQKKLKKLAGYAPMNFLHKYYLVEAEKSRVLKDDLKAIDYYDKAIELAAENEYLQEEALSNEIAAKFYLRNRKVKKAKIYLQEAFHCYKSWGANAKIKQLREKYPAISEEVIIEQILKKLVKILLENAGAQRVCYLTEKCGEYTMYIEGFAKGNQIEILQGADVKNDFSLPKSIIYYVEHTRENVIEDNASGLGNFMMDFYIASNKSKSIMCMPVLSKGELIGILYLENNLVPGAFNRERIEILKVISSQLAISLKNANLYNNLEELVELRTSELKEEISERIKAEKQLEEMATHDALTGLGNRVFFQNYLKELVVGAKELGRMLYVLFIDLDEFKEINDTLGHAGGDIVLKVVAERLLKCVGTYGIVSRLGGDEFTIILEDTDIVDYINITCKRIIKEVGRSIAIGENEGHVSASIGISVFPKDGDDMSELIKKADSAMYTAKKTGKNKFLFSS